MSSLSPGAPLMSRQAHDSPPAGLATPFGGQAAFPIDEDRECKEDGATSERAASAGAQPARGQRQLTLRAVAAGLLVGSALCCSNTYFGLQSGWVTMGSLQSAILGFGVFRLLEQRGLAAGLSVGENVILQTTAVATATMPLAAGLVGVIPALGMLQAPEGPVVLSTGQLIAWSLALAFLGVFCAIPLRTQTILREKLRFPSGTATAQVIRTLHEAPEPPPQMQPQQRTSSQPEDAALDGDEEARMPLVSHEETPWQQQQQQPERLRTRGSLDTLSARSLLKADSCAAHASLDSKLRCLRAKEEVGSSTEFERAWAGLMWTFAAAAAYTLAAAVWRPLRSFPVLTWLGAPEATAWGWELAPALGYVGQGMIMGPRTAASMLLGALAGYAVLGPLARARGWAPGPIGDWRTGAAGWILWVSLAIMLADSLTSLALLAASSARAAWRRRAGLQLRGSLDDKDPPGQGIPTWVWAAGLAASAAVCTAVLSPLLHMAPWQPLAAVAIALLVAVLAVRALGETDLNPVSGVGKLSQVVFAVIAPGRVVANLAAGAVAEAGAQQAGDMMQDFKTAHLLGVCPRSQCVAMLLGSAASMFVSVGAFRLYTAAYEVPGPQFPAPTASIWLDMAELVNGGHLPPHVAPFCVGGAVLGAALPLLAAGLNWWAERLTADPAASLRLLRTVRVLRRGVPSGIGVAVGLYVQAKWTVPRVIGSLIEQVWLARSPGSHTALMVVVASGLVLGEGTASIVTATAKALLAGVGGRG